jgi:hypothetical protein
MKFEEAIAEMRKGKRCYVHDCPDYHYYLDDGTLRYESKEGGVTNSEFFGVCNFDWRVFEPPPPLPPHEDMTIHFKLNKILSQLSRIERANANS